MKSFPCRCGVLILVDDDNYVALEGRLFDCKRSSSGLVREVSSNQPIAHLVKGSPPISDTFWDHKDRNNHNNQKDNLRLATRSQNNANRESYSRSGFKGVYYRKRYHNYKAQITVNKQSIYLGVTKTAEEAAQLYGVAAKRYFGEFAVLNFTAVV